MHQEVRGNRWVKAWLLAGVIMVLFQIVLGGVTRLTGSGLSITRWEIVTGTLPPMNASDWNAEFEAYKATPQYQKINAGMSIDQFKFIYFWEYVHRLWARLMGFVFLLPFLFFLAKGWISRDLIRRLGIVIGLAALAATFGWIMVASGLKDRPWVNAYKLTVHLSLGTSLFIFLGYTWLKERGHQLVFSRAVWRTRINWLIIVGIVQLAFGGFMAGMKASLNYPTWPDMHGDWIPAIVLDGSHWRADHFLMYDKSGFMPALVQVIHRHLGYVLLVMVVIFVLRWLREQAQSSSWIAWTLLGIIIAQITLGILTLVLSIGSIPVLYGALHQGVGILFIAFLFYIRLTISVKRID